jgi:hypothetical protein
LTSSTGVRTALTIAIVSQAIVMVGAFSSGVRIVLLVLTGAAALVTAPARAERGGGWWWLMTAGVAMAVLGAIVAQAADTLGGLLALLGGTIVIVFAFVGWPAAEDA